MPGNARLQEEPFPASAGGESPPYHGPSEGVTEETTESRGSGEKLQPVPPPKQRGTKAVAKSAAPCVPKESHQDRLGPFTSVFGDVFERWGKASGFHSTQLAHTVNSILVFPCSVHIIFINWERKSHLSLPRSSLTFKL